ncbi:MAG: hypothetical protein EA001_08010 [Oscillatoriales cyanobacterium]|nr:MAG: hypothetical protein EA001_08010 [Oscillatoriales cyanobacterium]
MGLGLAMAIGLGTGAIAQTPPAPGGGKAPKPSFFEESRRPSRTGFADTFVTDALDGMADPLGGRSAAGSGAPNSTGAGASRVRSGDTAPNNPSNPNSPAPPPVAPGLPPGFDRTTVIIRR